MGRTEKMCAICLTFEGRSSTFGPFLSCSTCKLHVHRKCYGADGGQRGGDAWFCETCEARRSYGNVWRKRCELCPSIEGALKRAEGGGGPEGRGWVHVVCANYLIPETEKFGNPLKKSPVLLTSVPKDRFSRTCYICEERGQKDKARVGAAIKCLVFNCSKTFHVTCGQQKRLLQGQTAPEEWTFYGLCNDHKERSPKESPHQTTLHPQIRNNLINSWQKGSSTIFGNTLLSTTGSGTSGRREFALPVNQDNPVTVSASVSSSSAPFGVTSERKSPEESPSISYIKTVFANASKEAKDKNTHSEPEKGKEALNYFNNLMGENEKLKKRVEHLAAMSKKLTEENKSVIIKCKNLEEEVKSVTRDRTLKTNELAEVVKRLNEEKVKEKEKTKQWEDKSNAFEKQRDECLKLVFDESQRIRKLEDSLSKLQQEQAAQNRRYHGWSVETAHNTPQNWEHPVQAMVRFHPPPPFLPQFAPYPQYNHRPPPPSYPSPNPPRPSRHSYPPHAVPNVRPPASQRHCPSSDQRIRETSRFSPDYSQRKERPRDSNEREKERSKKQKTKSPENRATEFSVKVEPKESLSRDKVTPKGSDAAPGSQRHRSGANLFIDEGKKFS